MTLEIVEKTECKAMMAISGASQPPPTVVY